MKNNFESFETPEQRRVITQRATPLPTEADITEDEALRIVRRELGEEAYVLDRVRDLPGTPRLGARYYAGVGARCYGNGVTWATAVEAALRMKRRRGGAA